jgi:hydroxymethylbilane synthase
MKLTFATRPSALAHWQTQYVIQLLQDQWPELSCEEVVITTKGDRILDKPLPEIGGKGLFTYELEQALFEKHVDVAVHSLKDLPIENTPGLTVGVIPQRADAHDVLVCPAGYNLDALSSSAIIGTSSIRRQAQLLAHKPDLQVKSIRGNVDTRIRKVVDGQYDAIILASAGITRLGLEEYITQYLPFEVMLPAPGQGALGIQFRVDDWQSRELLNAINHEPTHSAVTAERMFLSALGGGCSLPVGALASIIGDTFQLEGIVAAPDGSKVIRISDSDNDAQKLGENLAKSALSEGASELLSLVESK